VHNYAIATPKLRNMTKQLMAIAQGCELNSVMHFGSLQFASIYV